MSEIPGSAFSWPARVYWEDTDAGGVVYHARYLAFMERARSEWMRALGWDQGVLRDRDDQVFVVRAMDMLKVDPEGFDELDRRMLGIIIDAFDGGPVGVESLAAALSEERGTLEDVIEPYLIQQGFLVRTARGRMATPKAYRHLGFKPKAAGNAELFDG